MERFRRRRGGIYPGSPACNAVRGSVHTSSRKGTGGRSCCSGCRRSDPDLHLGLGILTSCPGFSAGQAVLTRDMRDDADFGCSFFRLREKRRFTGLGALDTLHLRLIFELRDTSGTETTAHNRPHPRRPVPHPLHSVRSEDGPSGRHSPHPRHEVTPWT